VYRLTVSQFGEIIIKGVKMFRKSVIFLVVCLIIFGIFIPKTNVNASPTQEFYNGEWELCYFSGWFIFEKKTCNTFNEGNYILSREDKVWTLNNWEEEINFRANVLTIEQKSLIGTLKVNALNMSMIDEPVIKGREFCEYDPYNSSMTCVLWGNNQITIIPKDKVYFTILARTKQSN
jgi:hypothetical protein